MRKNTFEFRQTTDIAEISRTRIVLLSCVISSTAAVGDYLNHTHTRITVEPGNSLHNIEK